MNGKFFISVGSMGKERGGDAGKKISVTLWVSFAVLCVLLLTIFSKALSGAGPGLISSAEAAISSIDETGCYLLDDPLARRTMSGMFETTLLWDCGRITTQSTYQLNQPIYPFPQLPITNYQLPFIGPDIPVSDPSGDFGISHTQSETSIAINPNNGVVCVAYNDSFHAIVQGNGGSGFSVSTDGGATFDDRGAFGQSNRGDPSLFWRRVDGKFYYMALLSNGMGLFAPMMIVKASPSSATSRRPSMIKR